MEPLFSPLEQSLANYLPEHEVEKVRQAFLLAEEAHAPQTRSSGEPYITHPVAVATILANMHFDAETVMAALLHDVIEDTEFSKQQIIERFGEQVGNLVDGVSKLTQFDFKTKAEAQAANFRKMMLAMASDIRVILIKLADRLHNMRTLGHLPPHKRRRIAKETLEIYAPIANRLGMRGFRDELQNLGFKALYPLRSKVLMTAVKKARGNRKEVIRSIETALDKVLGDVGISEYKLMGREKSLFSIYRKMKEKHLHLNEIMDVYAFRIVVKSVDLCYRVLGSVHNLYKPVPERFKDYIAIPKANGYQSLHTTLFGPYGLPIEIQIRTEDMQNVAENGIASHWLYKEKGEAADEAQMRARNWIKGILDIQESTGNSIEFIENVKIELFPDEVYVFTPKGDILELPAGATAVDFAYAVHSDVGNSCIAVKIDRRLSPLSTALRNGQRVEIVCAPGARPNPAWLNFVVTGKARSNIRHYLKTQQREESIQLGQRMLDQALLQYSTTLDQLDSVQIMGLIQVLELESEDDLFEAIGLGNQMAPILAQRLVGAEPETLESQPGETDKTLAIRGTEGMAVRFAKCCYPIPGDPVLGVLTSGRGIVVHREDCDTLNSFMQNHSDKCMPLRWEAELDQQFEVALIILVEDQRGALAALTGAVAGAESSIHAIQTRDRDERFVQIALVITVDDRTHLAQVIRRIRQIAAVEKIYRKKQSD